MRHGKPGSSAQRAVRRGRRRKRATCAMTGAACDARQAGASGTRRRKTSAPRRCNHAGIRHRPARRERQPRHAQCGQADGDERPRRRSARNARTVRERGGTANRRRTTPQRCDNGTATTRRRGARGGVDRIRTRRRHATPPLVPRCFTGEAAARSSRCTAPPREPSFAVRRRRGSRRTREETGAAAASTRDRRTSGQPAAQKRTNSLNPP